MPTHRHAYRILFPPQMRSLGAALLREEGVEVRGFPLAAAPVFHPGDIGRETVDNSSLQRNGKQVEQEEKQENPPVALHASVFVLQFPENIYHFMLIQ